MLILAGVSLNALVGDNGIITNAQNASIKTGMAALEEWLQQEYVSFYGDEMNSAENASNKPEFLASKIDDLFLKEDSSRNYVINGGRSYYLLNKSCTRIPKEVRDGLKGGDTTDIDSFIRLIDVYGITEDLKVFYIDTNSGTTYGNVENYKIDPTLKSMKALGNPDVASQLSSALNARGFSSTPDNITVGQISTLSNFTLNGVKENGEPITGITDLSAISDATSLETLTLENLKLSSMRGLEKLTKLYYLYLRNVTCEDYSALCSLWELTHLYIYMPSATMDETTCNAQVINLGEGLANASKLTKLKNFGISGIETLFTANTLTFKNNSNIYISSDLGVYSLSCFADNKKSNLSNLGTITTGLGKFNSVIKDGLTLMLLNNNSFSEINALKDFSVIYQLHLMSNKNLYDVSGITNHSTIKILTLQDCALGRMDSSGVVATYRATGLTGLEYLSIENNANLSSLQGLEKSSNLKTLIAHNCNLTDISALGTYTYKTDAVTGDVTTIINQITNPHSDLTFLNLRKNSNLVSVDSIGGLIGLTELYMQGCSSLEYDSSYVNINMGIGKLTNTYVNAEEKNQILFLQLSNSYDGLDQKYKPLFENLLVIQSKNIYFSTDKLKNLDGTPKVLEDSDPLINALKSRTDIELLDLGGQTKLNVSTINTIISSNSGSLKYLSLNGLTKIEHFGDYDGEDAEWVTYRAALKAARESDPPTEDPDKPSSEGKAFIKTLPALDDCSVLKEIDVRGTSDHVSMRQITEKRPIALIILDNSNINTDELKTHFQTYWNSTSNDQLYKVVTGTLCISGDGSAYDFVNFSGSEIYYSLRNVPTDLLFTGTLDFSLTTITKANVDYYGASSLTGIFKYPKSLISFSGSRGANADDFSQCLELKSYQNTCCNGDTWRLFNSKIRLTTFGIRYGYKNSYNFSDCTFLDGNSSFDARVGEYGATNIIAGDCLEFNVVKMNNSNYSYTPFVEGLGNLVSTKTILLKSVECEENAEFYSSLNNLTLENVNISNIKFVKPITNVMDTVVNIKIINCSDLSSFSVLPDNLSIGSLDISGCPISSDYMETLCSRFYRNGNLIVDTFSLKSDSLASTATVGTQWVKPLLELHQAGLPSIKIGGKSVDSQAIEWLKNGVEIDGVQYAGFGASNVTIYN